MRFLLVDRILELPPGESIRTVRTFSPDEEFFQDHFPGFPVVPGVLLTETIVQSAGKCLDSEKTAAIRGKAMLARIESATFRDWVRPGQEREVSEKIYSSRPRFARAEGHIEVGGNRTCSAALFFSFVPGEQFARDYRDELLERYLAESVK